MRDKIIEVMATAIEEAFWADSSSSDIAEAALTAYESHLQAEGMTVVPVETAKLRELLIRASTVLRAGNFDDLADEIAAAHTQEKDA